MRCDNECKAEGEVGRDKWGKAGVYEGKARREKE